MDSGSAPQLTHHPLRSALPPEALIVDEAEMQPQRSDIAFFFISFASAFVIFYGVFC